MVMDSHHHFAADSHRSLRHQVERTPHRALGRVLHRHDAEIGRARFDRAEDFVDRGAGKRVGGEPEVLQSRALTEGPLGPQVGDRERTLERQARRHDFAKQQRRGLRRERSRVALLDAAQDLRLALGAIGLPHLERADGARELRALVDRFEDAVVDAVDCLAQPLELRGAAHRLLATSGTLRIESTPGMWAMRWITSSGAALSRSTSVYAISPFDLLSMLWMFRPACAIVVDICPTMFGTLALAIAMRNGDSRAISTLGKFTALATVPSSRNPRSCSTTMSAQFSSASSVEAPRCGSASTPGWPFNFGLGKSVTYLRRCFSASAASTASSSAMASRAKLSSTMRRACASFLASMRLRVLSVSGRCSETNSAPLMTSSIEPARFTAEGSRHALSTVISGS